MTCQRSHVSQTGQGLVRWSHGFRKTPVEGRWTTDPEWAWRQCRSCLHMDRRQLLNDAFERSQLGFQAALFSPEIFDLVQQHFFLQPELCDVCLLRCLRLWLAFVEPSFQLGGATLLDLELFFQFLNFLLSGHYFTAQALFDGPSSLQVLDFSSQALVEVTNLAQFLGFIKAVGEVTINNLPLDILRSLDPVDFLARQEPGAILDDVHSVCDVFCCAKFCRLKAHGC